MLIEHRRLTREWSCCGSTAEGGQAAEKPHGRPCRPPCVVGLRSAITFAGEVLRGLWESTAGDSVNYINGLAMIPAGCCHFFWTVGWIVQHARECEHIITPYYTSLQALRTFRHRSKQGNPWSRWVGQAEECGEPGLHILYAGQHR